MWLTEYYEEIFAKYGIGPLDAENILKLTAEQYYSHLLRCPVICDVKDNNITVKRYIDTGFGARETSIQLRKSDIRRMSGYLISEYESFALKARYRYLRPFIDKSVQCTFMRYDGNNSVFFTENGDLSHITAYCSQRDTPVSERGQYSPGQILWFHVTGLYIRSQEISFQVSRTSKRLVEDLFATQGSIVQCTRRIAGAKSIILLHKKIPKTHIVSVSNELHEKIYVEVSK